MSYFEVHLLSSVCFGGKSWLNTRFQGSEFMMIMYCRILLFFQDEVVSLKKVSIGDPSGKRKDRFSESTGAPTPQSSVNEEGTGLESKTVTKGS